MQCKYDMAERERERESEREMRPARIMDCLKRNMGVISATKADVAK